MNRLMILEGHVLDKLRGIADSSVHCIVTSPPFWGLRDYKLPACVWGGKADCVHDWGEPFEAAGSRSCDTKPGKHSSEGQHNRDKRQRSAFCIKCNAWRGQFGFEPARDLFIAHAVEIFRECRRVLHPSGVLFVDIGDNYATGTTSRRGASAAVDVGRWQDDGGGNQRTDGRADGLKPKDRCLIPERLAIALQADGWWVRDKIVWCKRAPMPESVVDRCTNAWEPIYMLTKSAHYFWDGEAVKEPASNDTHARTAAANEFPGNAERDEHRRRPGVNPKCVSANSRFNDRYKTKQNESFSAAVAGLVSSRNLRNWWPLGPEPYKEAHFATFPTEIPRRCILAATSARGVCPVCLAPWERVTQPSERYAAALGEDIHGKTDELGQGKMGSRGVNKQNGMRAAGCVGAEYITTGWQPTCGCGTAETIPATVLDPFAGSGTTGAVAIELGRAAVLIELSPAYVKLIHKRLATVTSGLRLA